MHTVEAAAARGIPVGAVPGSIRSPTRGTNALWPTAAFRCARRDILAALSLAGAAVSVPPTRPPTPPARGRDAGPRPPDPPPRLPRGPTGLRGPPSVDPTPLDELARVTGLDLAELCGGLERLAQAGLACDVGGWWERA